MNGSFLFVSRRLWIRHLTAQDSLFISVFESKTPPQSALWAFAEVMAFAMLPWGFSLLSLQQFDMMSWELNSSERPDSSLRIEWPTLLSGGCRLLLPIVRFALEPSGLCVSDLQPLIVAVRCT